MRQILLAACLAAAVSPVSAASLSSTITAASDYLFDGVSQNQGDDDSKFNPVLQASLDLGWDNGVYVGTWGSMVNFGSEDPADAEVDFYVGWATDWESGWGIDVGIADYTYANAPSEGYDYMEGYVGVTFPTGTGVKAFYADDDDVLGGYAWRVKGTHSFALNDTYSLDLEATYTDYEEGDGFFHGQVGVSRSAGPFDLYLGYVDTDIQDDPAAAGRFLFTISTTVEIF